MALVFICTIPCEIIDLRFCYVYFNLNIKVTKYLMSDIQRKNDLELRGELYRVGVIGLGFVGGAMYRSFQEKGVSVYGYDKYKDGGIGDLETCLKCGILFLCLPTLYDKEAKEYDKCAIEEVLSALQDAGYGGTVVLKSTIEPGVMNDACCTRFDKLNLVHNPEFLTARTAYHDFHNQMHITCWVAAIIAETNTSTACMHFTHNIIRGL